MGLNPSSIRLVPQLDRHSLAPPSHQYAMFLFEILPETQNAPYEPRKVFVAAIVSSRLDPQKLSP